MDRTSKLRSDIDDSLTEYVIKLLNKHNIGTVEKFMGEQNGKLCEITNLSIEEISSIRSSIFQRIIGSYRLKIEKTIQMDTGIESFDELIEGGGLVTGNIYEFYGFSAAGKTQICTTIALNILQKNVDFETFYIDTKRDFSGTRIHNQLLSQNLCETAIHQIMERIKCERCHRVDQFMSLLRRLLSNMDKFERLKLLIIDSLPSLWHQSDAAGEQGLILLCEMGHILRKIAFEHQIVVLVVNIPYSEVVFDYDADNLTHDESTNNFSTFDYAPIETDGTVLPALGPYWQAIPSARFLVEKTDVIDYIEDIPTDTSSASVETASVAGPSDSAKNTNKIPKSEISVASGSTEETTVGDVNLRRIIIVKSCELPYGKQCIVRITDIGVV